MSENKGFNPVGWFEIYVEDMSRAKDFYESVFQTTLEKMPSSGNEDMPDLDMWTFPGNMDQFGIYGALVKMEGVPSGQNSTLVYFNCDDCSVEANRVESAGGTVVRPKFDIGEYGFISMVQDTEGNMIGLHSQK